LQGRVAVVPLIAAQCLLAQNVVHTARNERDRRWQGAIDKAPGPTRPSAPAKSAPIHSAYLPLPGAAATDVSPSFPRPVRSRSIRSLGVLRWRVSRSAAFQPVRCGSLCAVIY
jgi:hypothetical protein